MPFLNLEKTCNLPVLLLVLLRTFEKKLLLLTGRSANNGSQCSLQQRQACSFEPCKSIKALSMLDGISLDLPVGKSGAGMCFMSPFILMSGSAISAFSPCTTSRRLCGGMRVAIPTAIPDAPFTSRCGIRAGRTVGSSREPSNVGFVSMVSNARSARKTEDVRASRRHSVYLQTSKIAQHTTS